MKRTRRTHGMYATPTYWSWVSMKSRCDNPRAAAFQTYGAVGITYCEEWDKFENFYADMGARPQGTSLDRKDNAGNYEPENCRWSTPKQQTLNRRQTLYLTHNGETLCQRDWEVKLGLSRGTIYCRLATGWPLKDALSLGANVKRQRE